MQVLSVIPTHNSANLVKIGPVHSKILGGICRIFQFLHTGTQMTQPRCISGVTGPKFTKLLQDVVQYDALFLRPSSFRYSNLFQNASRPMLNEGLLQILA